MRTFDLETTGLGFESVLAVKVVTFSSHRPWDSFGTGRLEGRCNGKLGAFKLPDDGCCIAQICLYKSQVAFCGLFYPRQCRDVTFGKIVSLADIMFRIQYFDDAMGADIADTSRYKKFQNQRLS